MSVFKLENISKVYGNDKEKKLRVNALQDIDLTIESGEFTALVGASGSGKTTLLNIMSGLDVQSAGKALVKGTDISKMTDAALSNFRRDHIGFVFQSHNLISVLTVEENVEYVMILQGITPAERRVRVQEVLADLGLEGREKSFPRALSGGQSQRVAIARAMASKPDIILADEPTANLDSKMGTALIEKMKMLNQKYGTTFVFSTHDPIIMERAERLVTLQDGRIV
ncbi:MAG: ABC transporter ATP-binding protein [Alphaproteobacteria bacterium]